MYLFIPRLGSKHWSSSSTMISSKILFEGAKLDSFFDHSSLELEFESDDFSTKLYICCQELKTYFTIYFDFTVLSPLIRNFTYTTSWAARHKAHWFCFQKCCFIFKWNSFSYIRHFIYIESKYFESFWVHSDILFTWWSFNRSFDWF